MRKDKTKHNKTIVFFCFIFVMFNFCFMSASWMLLDAIGCFSQIHKPSPQDSNTIMRSELYNCSAVFHVVNCTPKCLCTHIQGPHWPKCLCNSSTALIWPVEVEDIPRYCIIWCVMYVNASTDLVLTGNVTVLFLGDFL